MHILNTSTAWPLIACVMTLSLSSADAEPGRLKPTGVVTRDDLKGAAGVTISKDGATLYAAAMQAANIAVFQRDRNDGSLKHVQNVTSKEELSGVTTVALSPDGRYAASAAFDVGSVVLYERNPGSGELKRIAAVSKRTEGVRGLDFAIRTAFSKNGKQIYVLDGARGGITALEINSGSELKWIQTTHDENTMAGSRGLVMLPQDNLVLTAHHLSHSVVLLDRDVSSGFTTIRQVARDGVDGVQELEGVFGAAATADGKFIYVCSGRFGGDQSVSAFSMTPEGKLVSVQELRAGQGKFRPFRGGNSVAVSPDGKNVYATATESGSLACFERESTTGQLTCVETITSNSDNHLEGAAGLVCSPDGRFVYVAAEFENTISIYERSVTKAR